jgi:hypothetical protein
MQTKRLAGLEPVTGLIGAENVAPREAVRPFPDISYFESGVEIFCLFASDDVAAASFEQSKNVA